MAGFRFGLALVLTLTLAQAGLSQTKVKRTKPADTQADKNAVICKIYPLGELGDDPNLGQWIANTIPEVIQAGSWSIHNPYQYAMPMPSPMPMAPPGTTTSRASYYQPPTGQMSYAPVTYYVPTQTPYVPGQPSDMAGKRTLSYYAPAKLLVVNHTVAVHGQIESFLANLKKALPTPPRMAPPMPMPGPTHVPYQQTTPTSPPIAPTAWVAPTRVPESVAYNKATAYPVPAPLAQPKHLFHLIIRYEGDGVVDANVASLVKSYFGEPTAKDETGDKAKTDAKAPSLNQLFNFIIRYEGDGIIDSNVVALMKSYMAAEKKSAEVEKSVTLPAGAYLQRSPEYVVPVPFSTPSIGLPSSPRMPPADAGSGPAPALGPQRFPTY